MVPSAIILPPSTPTVPFIVPLQRFANQTPTVIACDHGVGELAFTKTDGKNEWNLYVKCNGENRTYKITIQ